MSDEQKKPGLRFEVYLDDESGLWFWVLIGAEGTVCYNEGFDSEAAARSHIAKNRGRLKAAGRAKVITA